MTGTYRNNPWHASTFTTAAGIALEQRDSTIDAAAQGWVPRIYRLRGYTVSGSTAVSISTSPMKIIYGRSSVDAVTQELCQYPGVSMVGVSGIVGIEGEYIGIESTQAHGEGGLVITMFGD